MAIISFFSQNLLKNVDLLVISLPKVSLEACSDGSCISLSLFFFFFFFFFFSGWCCHGVTTQVFYSENIRYKYHMQSWIWI